MLFALSSTSCLQSVSLGRIFEVPGPDAGDAPTWGRYVTTSLSLPACAPAPILLVNDVTDEMQSPTVLTVSEAGATLSLPEALSIAANVAGPHTIQFDPLLFALDAPATIRVTTSEHHFTRLEQTCIDGRGSGAIIEWATHPSAVECPTCIFSLGQGSMLLALTLANMPAPLTVTGAQVAGCRLESRFDTIELQGPARLGPGNVIAGATGVRVNSNVSGQRVVDHNAFGYDPVLRSSLRLERAVSTSQAIFFNSNLVRNTPTGIFSNLPVGSTETLAVRESFFGVDESGAPLPGNVPGTALALISGQSLIEQNVIWGSSTAVFIDHALAIVTRNMIFGNDKGIEYVRGSPVPAPTITAASQSEVSGTCAMAGMLELFSDGVGQGERFLDSVHCDTLTAWRIRNARPTGRNVTATLTSREGVIGTSPFSSPVLVRP